MHKQHSCFAAAKPYMVLCVAQCPDVWGNQPWRDREIYIDIDVDIDIDIKTKPSQTGLRIPPCRRASR